MVLMLYDAGQYLETQVSRDGRVWGYLHDDDVARRWQAHRRVRTCARMPAST